MRGVLLGELLTQLRAELRQSLSTAHNDQANDTQIRSLQRTQEWLWEDYAWPHLRAERYIRPQIGLRYYDPAGCKKIDQTTGALVAAGDVKVDRIDSVMLRDGDVWTPPLYAGIATEHFNQWDSDAGERAWPPTRWQTAENDMIEIWPVPDQDGNETTFANMLKIVATRDLAALANPDTDRADLDDRLIVLYAAADLARDDDLGKKKLALANKRLLDLRGNAVKKRTFRVFGSGDRPGYVRRGPPTVYYRTT